MKAKISILIPTYNREEKILSLLNKLNVFFESNKELKSFFEIHISNNGSTDQTANSVSNFIKEKDNFYFYNQNINLGFDKNIKFLYDQVKTDYLWFFSDDDIFYEEAFQKIISSVSIEKPDILLFSFAQPASNLKLTFDLPLPVYNTFDTKEIIESIALFPKLSIYVMKKINIPNDFQLYLNSIIGRGFYFLSLSYTVLSLSQKPKLTILPEQLACCDEEYNHFSINPDIFLYFYETFSHPFVLKYYPNLHKIKKPLSYINTLEYLYKIKEGKFIVNKIEDYDKYIKSFPFQWDVLLVNPPLLLQYILLKTKSVQLFHKYGKPFYDKLIKPFRKYYN